MADMPFMALPGTPVHNLFARDPRGRPPAMRQGFTELLKQQSEVARSWAAAEIPMSSLSTWRTYVWAAITNSLLITGSQALGLLLEMLFTWAVCWLTFFVLLKGEAWLVKRRPVGCVLCCFSIFCQVGQLLNAHYCEIRSTIVLSLFF